MDIYQRRRLTAVGVFVAFISVIAIAAGSGGGASSTTPASTGTNTTGASGAAGSQPLSKPDFIAQVDSICSQANSAIAGATGVGTAVPDPGVKIRTRELNQLNSLAPPTKGAADLKAFLKAFKQLVSGVKQREQANKSGNTAGEGQAQSTIDTATTDLSTAGDAYGFKTCNSLSSTGSAGSKTGTTGTGAATGTGTVAPSGGAVTPPTDTTVTPTAPPADTTPPASPTPSGGDTGGSGGVTP